MGGGCHVILAGLLVYLECVCVYLVYVVSGGTQWDCPREKP